MSIPVRLAVQKALTTLIESTLLSDEDGEDLTGRVFRGRRVYGDNDPVPMVSILEPPLAIQQLPVPQDSPTRTGDWDVLVQGWVKDDPSNPTDPAYELSARVCQVLANHKRLVGGMLNKNLFGLRKVVTNLNVGAPVVRPSDETSSTSCFYLIITLQMVEDLSNPFV